jgi:hypothetical protein
MAYPALQLINRAWYLSGIVARNLETVSGDQATDGLFLLNTLLDFKASDIRLIPYFTRYADVFVVGQERYFVEGLYEIETMTFNIGNVRYPMAQTTRDIYFGTGRVDNINSLPFSYHLERAKGGSYIYVYFLPNQAYEFNLSGKFALTDVSINEDLSEVYDNFYLEYLRYALAQFICNEYNISFAPEKLQMLKMYEKKLMDVSPPDLTIRKVSFMGDRNTLNWAMVNVSGGYLPSN